MLGTILAAAALAIEGISAVADHKAQEDQAKATRESAQRALQLTRRDLAIRSIQETRAASQSVLQGQRYARQLRGTARASAAAAGVAGRSAEALVADITRGEAEYIQSVRNNLVVTLDQLQRLREGAEAEAQSRINQAQGPSLLNTALRIGGAGLRFGDFIYRHYRIPGEEANG